MPIPTSDQLTTRAVEQTRLEDFGPDHFKLGLNALLESLETDGPLNEQAQEFVLGHIMQLLVNRLQVTELVKQEPRILAEDIKTPIIITGLPRSGTTLLHTLLALDPRARYLRNWESFGPICPPPELIHGVTDPRIEMHRQIFEELFKAHPTIKAINGHNAITGGTAECQNLLAHDFSNFVFAAGFGLASYGQWLSSHNLAPAYQYHHLLLKLLQFKWPNEYWVLKAPMHLFGLDHLLNEYPDARIVFTHRDPVVAMASGASLFYNWSLPALENPRPETLGDWYPGLWNNVLNRALKVRDKHPNLTVCDVYHEDITNDPIDVVGRIYNVFGLEVTSGHLSRMRVWLRENPRKRYGRHSYHPRQFGMQPEKVKEMFKSYINRFYFSASLSKK